MTSPAARVVLLLGAGLWPGSSGSAGGTASLISYPALLAAGLPPLPANITNAVAFVAAWPGSALGSRPELRGQGRQLLRWAPARGGRAAPAGAGLLLVTPERVFDQVVPFLLTAAAIILLVQPAISAWLARRQGQHGRFLLPGGLIATAAYDGYWGAGAGDHDPRPADDRSWPAAPPVQRAEEHAARRGRRDVLHPVHRVLAG